MGSPVGLLGVCGLGGVAGTWSLLRDRTGSQVADRRALRLSPVAEVSSWSAARHRTALQRSGNIWRAAMALSVITVATHLLVASPVTTAGMLAGFLPVDAESVVPIYPPQDHYCCRWSGGWSYGWSPGSSSSVAGLLPQAARHTISVIVSHRGGTSADTIKSAVLLAVVLLARLSLARRLQRPGS